MPIGSLGVREQFSPVNPITQPKRIQAQARSPQQEQVRQTAQTHVRPNPVAPQANARVLTSQETIQAFEGRLANLNVADIPQQVQQTSWGTRLKNFLMGKGTATAEVHGLTGLTGAYMANTPGSVQMIAANGSLDPTTAATDEANSRWGGLELLTGGALTDKANPIGASLGGATALAGMVLSWRAINQGKETRSMGSQDQAIAQELRNVSNLLSQGDYVGARGIIQQDIHALDQQIDGMGQSLANMANGPEKDILSNECALLTLRRTELNNRLGVIPVANLAQVAVNQGEIGGMEIDDIELREAPVNHPPVVNRLITAFQNEASALDALGKIKESRGTQDVWEGRVAFTNSVNSFINAGFTVASIYEATGTTAGNVIAGTLIATQGIAGIGGAVIGGWGCIRDSVQAHKATQRLKKIEAFLQKQDTDFTVGGVAPTVQEKEQIEQVRDAAKMAKNENTMRRKMKIGSAVKNALVAAGGVALAVGVFAGTAALAATPVGWALGGVALVGGICLGIYKLYKKNQQKKQIGQLEQQEQRVTQALNTAQVDIDLRRGAIPGLGAQASQTQRPHFAQAVQIATQQTQAQEGVLAQSQQAEAQSSQRIQALTGQIGDVDHTLGQLSQAKDRAVADRSQLQTGLQDLGTQKTDLNQHRAHLQKRQHDLSIREEDTSTKIDGLTAQIEKVEQERRNAKQESRVCNFDFLGFSVAKNSDPSALIETLKNQLSDAKDQLGKIQNEQQGITQDVEIISTQIGRLDRKIDRQREKLDQTEHQLVSLQGQITSARQERLNLVENLAHEQNTHEVLIRTVEQEQASLLPLQQTLDQAQQNLHNLDDLITAETSYQSLQELHADVSVELRQHSPKAGLETLVSSLADLSPANATARRAAVAMCSELLPENLRVSSANDGVPDVLKGEPVVVAEILRKYIGLAYL